MTALRRFASLQKPRPAEVVYLGHSHPAVVSGHTMFPKSVVSATDAPRLLVSGMNNRKIGAKVMKGPWTGMAIYMLTLEERATCPRTCFMWRSCYGNALHRARRHVHGAEFEARLQREVRMLARENPVGFVVRLHVLGDFYSAEYATLWTDMLARHPELHLFGYTSRSDEHDPAIAAAITAMNATSPQRCFIRTSAAEPRPGGASVVMANVPVPGSFVCPAETQSSECCATCGLCWAPAARDKTVLFLKHGMTRSKGRRAAA